MHARPALELALFVLGSVVLFYVGKGREIATDIAIQARLGFVEKLFLRCFQEPCRLRNEIGAR